MSEYELAIATLILMWVFVSPVSAMMMFDIRSMSGIGFWADYKAAFKVWHLLWVFVAVVFGVVCALFWALQVVFG